MEYIDCPSLSKSQEGQLPVGGVCQETGLSAKAMQERCPIRRSTDGVCHILSEKINSLPRGFIEHVKEKERRKQQTDTSLIG